MIFFGISLLGKEGFPCLLRGSLAYIFNSVLINMKYFNRVCGNIVSSYRKFFTLYCGEIMGSETFLMLINLNVVLKRLVLHENITPSFISDGNMLLLTGKT